jgi:hypothetical protein
MSYQNRNFNTQQSGNIKPIWNAAGIRQLPIDPFIDGKVSNGSILFWDRGNQYWTVIDKNVKRLTCYGQYLIWDGTTWIIVGDENVKLGCQSGKFSQGTYSVAIGNDAGYCNQNSNSVAIGLRAGYSNQGSNSLALGNCSGETKQGNFAVSIGYGAGAFTQNDYAISIGNFAGITKQGANSISIGRLAGAGTQNDGCIAIGYGAGYSLQGTGAMAFGKDAGKSSQGTNSIALGQSAGEIEQGPYSFAAGLRAGNLSQGNDSVALGFYAGESNQGNSSIAIGSFAANVSQNDTAIAIGYSAGSVSQGNNSISIGKEAGYFSQGSDSIAIGPLAGYTGQHPNTIILSATGGALNSDKTGALFVNPIALRATGTNEVLYYDSGNNEVFRASNFPQNYPVAISVNPSSQLFAQGVVQPIIFNNITDGINGTILKGWISNGVFLICPEDGLYLITCIVNYEPPGEIPDSIQGNFIITFVRDPAYPITPIGYGAAMPADTQATNSISLTYIFNLSQNDIIAVNGKYDSQGATSIGLQLNSAYLTIHKIGSI